MSRPNDIAEQLRKPYLHNATYDYTIPTALIAVWVSCGWIFQLDFDLDDDDKVDALVHWWLRGARHDFPGIADFVDDSLVSMLHSRPLEDRVAQEEPFLTPLMQIVLRHRVDLRSKFSVDTLDAIRAFWGWWLTAGEAEYLGSRRSAIIPAFCLDGSLKSDLPSHLLYIWANRPDLSDRFDVATQEGRDALLYWWVVDGADQYRQYCGSHVGLTAASFSGFVGERLVPPVLDIVWKQRTDLLASFDRSTVAGRYAFLAWWFANGHREYPAVAEKVGASLRDSLSRGGMGESAADGVMPTMELVWKGRPDLQAAFDLTSDVGRAGLVDWWQKNGRASYPDLFPRDPAGPAGHEASIPASSGAIARGPDADGEAAHRISLIGHPRGEFGLGEDIRLMRVSLRSVGIEPEIVRVPWKITAREQQNEASIEAEDATFDNDVTFFVMPAFDTTLMLAKSGPKAFGAKRRIGFWQWELEKFPEPAKIAMDLVDEIWCHSEHSAKAFRSATDKPVIKVPLPVIVPTVRQASRSEFGLPDDCFIIFTSFDGASAIARKNPLGAIEAFGKAFPAAEHPDKRLVVKAMNTAYDSLWRECLRRAELDDRILIREGVLDKDDYYALLTSCDAILSLHRSEGFGRLMAEGMALGIPVIATGYSGNMDFMNEGNSWPVGGSLVTVLAGDYAFHQDQVWMQPDTDLAAAALLECATNPGLRATKIEAARRTIEAYSPEACGRRYRQLLDEGPSATA